jgi:glycerol-3-phosphate dehydrogenase
MWHKGWRETIWSNIQQDWDILIVGGGITGAGVLRMAVNAGLKALLVEQNDFTFGTSSRSSKLIHGGFRYLREGQMSVTKESVREREWLLKVAPHLVTRLGFVLADYENFHIPLAEYGLGVVIYDLLAPKWNHKRLRQTGMIQLVPGLRADGLLGGYLYYDAHMDDSRVVLRLLRESVRDGGTALSYTRAEKLLRTADGKVCGVALHDMSTPQGKTVEVKAQVVINASGPWSDELRAQVGGTPHMRKLRGSHLIFSQERWPLPSAATLVHPRDHRTLFVIPWEGTSMIGTTDLDHSAELEQKYAEPFASQEEIDYLLEALNFLFPDIRVTQKDIISTFSGVRPTIAPESDSNPSHVSRAHALYQESGLITITGGKFTTFRIMARQTIQAALAQLGKPLISFNKRIFQPLAITSSELVDLSTSLYLQGRHGFETGDLLASAQPGELETIAPLANIWAELRWAARQEGVLHLDDLLLRRVRLGVLLPNGAVDLLPRIRKIVQPELGWDDQRWQSEEKAYLDIWKTYYSPNPG